MYSFFHQRRIGFSETDMAGIVHFANFFRYMEEAEHAFYRSLGSSVQGMAGDDPGTTVGWPRVHAEADYKLPLRFEEEIDVEVLVEEVRGRSIAYRFRFWKSGAPNEPKSQLAATGRLVVVCASLDASAGQMRAVKVPQTVRDMIVAAPDSVLESESRSDG